MEQKIVLDDPTRKLKTPRTRKPCEQFLTMEEYVAPMEALPTTRDRIIVRFGDDVTPGELFALRWNDIRANRLRIDESVPDLKNRVSKRRRLRTARHS